MSKFRTRDRARGQKPKVGVARLPVVPGDRIGHCYQNEAEARALAAEFLAQGLRTGTEQCVYLCPNADDDTILQALEARGVDVEGALSSGQLTLRRDRPSPERLRDSLRSAPSRFDLVRWAGDLSWSFHRSPTDESTLTEWAAATHAPHVLSLCQYDLRRLTGRVMLETSRAHEWCITGSAILRNPRVGPIEESERIPEARACVRVA